MWSKSSGFTISCTYHIDAAQIGKLLFRFSLSSRGGSGWYRRIDRWVGILDDPFEAARFSVLVDFILGISLRRGCVPRLRRSDLFLGVLHQSVAHRVRPFAADGLRGSHDLCFSFWDP